MSIRKNPTILLKKNESRPCSVTIITITLNDLKGLMATSSVVLEVIEKNKDIDWLVIDGGSSDGTRAFLESINSERFSFVSGRDGGIYQAMQRGVDLARGTYVNFMNSGDVPIKHNYLKAVSEVIASGTGEMVYAYASEFSGLKRKEIFMPLLLKFPGHQAIFFPKGLIQNYGFDFKRLKISNDLLHKALAWRDEVLLYDRSLTIVCCDPSGTSRRNVTIKEYSYRINERYLIGKELFGIGFGILCALLYIIWNLRKLRIKLVKLKDI